LQRFDPTAAAGDLGLQLRRAHDDDAVDQALEGVDPRTDGGVCGGGGNGIRPSPDELGGGRVRPGLLRLLETGGVPGDGLDLRRVGKPEELADHLVPGLGGEQKECRGHGQQ
jgi:hypothetical protein